MNKILEKVVYTITMAVSLASGGLWAYNQGARSMEEMYLPALNAQKQFVILSSEGNELSARLMEELSLALDKDDPNSTEKLKNLVSDVEEHCREVEEARVSLSKLKQENSKK